MTEKLKNKWTLLFLVIPFFKPVCLQYIGFLQPVDHGYIIWKMIAAAGIFGVYLDWIRRDKPVPTLILWTILLEGSIFLTTLFRRGNLGRAMIDGVSMVVFVLLLTMGMKEAPCLLLDTLRQVLGTLAAVQFLLMLPYPNGLPAAHYHNPNNALYFMVVDNGNAPFLLMTQFLAFADLQTACGRRKWADWGIFGICALSALISRSATAIVTVGLFTGLMLLREKLPRWVTPKAFGITYGAILLYLLSMRENGILNRIIVAVTRRSPDFSGRFQLWNVAMKKILQAPLFGWGRIDGDYIPAWGGMFSSHNFFLELLLQGGLLALFCFLMVGRTSLRGLRPCGTRPTVTILSAALFLVMTAALMESAVHSVYIFGLLALCRHCRILADCVEKKRCY